MFAGLSTEDMELAMSQISLVDKTDINSWKQLEQTFKDLDIAIP
jgi:hypothetical protein